MTPLYIDSFKVTHAGLNWLEHEVRIILNVIHLTMLIYYLLYELLSVAFSKFFHFPYLPTVNYFKRPAKSTALSQWAPRALKLAAFAGATCSFIGAANWKLSYSIAGCIIRLPFVAYDLYLFVIDRFHLIDVDDFLLFQTLFATTTRFFGMASTFANVVLLIEMSLTR